MERQKQLKEHTSQSDSCSDFKYDERTKLKLLYFEFQDIAAGNQHGEANENPPLAQSLLPVVPSTPSPDIFSPPDTQDTSRTTLDEPLSTVQV